MPGVAAYGCAEARRWAEQAAEAGCAVRDAAAAQRLPRRRAAVVAHYREVAEVGLPIVAYNNPFDTKVDLTPDLLARLHGEGQHRRGQGVHRRRAPGLRDRRTRPGPGLLIGADDVLLELAIAGRGRLGRRLPERAARRVRRALPRGRRRRPGHRAAAVPSRCTRCCAGTPGPSSSRPSSCRWTSSGRHGGPCRPPRVAARRRAGGRRTRRHREGRRRRPPSRKPPAAPMTGRHAQPTRLPRRRLAHRGHADPGDHRRRRRHPRRHHGRAAAALHRAPRPHPHAADERAARPLRDERRDPAAADPARRRLGRAVHRGLRLPADVRARHDRRGDRARRDRHGRGHRAGHHDPAGHPGRAGRRRGARSRTAPPRRSPSPTCPPSAVGLDRKVDVPGLGDGDLRPGVRRQLLRDRDARRSSACRSTAPARTTSSPPAWPSWTPINAEERARPPRGPRHPRLPPRLLRPRPAPTPATRGTRWRSTPAGSTARRAAPAPAPGWPSCTPAANCPLHTDFVNESFIGTRFIGRLVGDDRRSAACPRSCPPSPAAPGSPAPPSTCSTRRPVPGGVRPVDLCQPSTDLDDMAGYGYRMTLHS